MFSIDEFIIAVFCCVADLMKGQKIRSRGFAPALSDSEVITMEIVAEYLGIDSDKGIWQYFHQHWFSWFPQMTSRSTFVRQAANLKLFAVERWAETKPIIEPFHQRNRGSGWCCAEIPGFCCFHREVAGLR